MNPIFTKAYTARGPIERYSIVKYGVADGEAVQAGAATDRLLGVSTVVDTVDGQTVDVHRLGIAFVTLGGTVSAGDEITSDADGKAVALTGTGESIGRAEQGGVAGTVITVFLRPFTRT